MLPSTPRHRSRPAAPAAGRGGGRAPRRASPSRLLPLLALLAGLALPAPAGPYEIAAPAVWALTGARVVVAPGRVLEPATVIVRDGVVEAVGRDLEPPPDARVEDLSGMSIYPGLIDAYAERPWPQDEPSPAAAHANPAIRPEREAALHPLPEAFAEARREAGFTTALVAPPAAVVGGWSALVNLGDGGLRANLVRRRVAQHATLEAESGVVYPASTMGAVALFRQAVLDARWYRSARATLERAPAQRRVPYDRGLEAFEPAAFAERPLIFTAGDPNAARRAADVAAELELDAMLFGHGREYQQLPELAAAGLPLILPLAYPEPPEVGDEGEALHVGLAELRHWDQAPANAPRALDAGLTVAFGTLGLERPRDVFPAIARAKQHGLSDEQALAAFTTVPARLFGVDDRLGTIEAGKWANLLVVEGELWIEKPALRQVWVDGERFELGEDEKNKKRGEPGEPGEPEPEREEARR